MQLYERGWYLNVKSQFIRKLIKNTSWRDKRSRVYIDNLILLERFIMNGPKSILEAMYYNVLKNKYREEWEIIYIELKPEEYEKMKINKTKEKRKNLGKTKEELTWLKEEWFKMGGKK